MKAFALLAIVLGIWIAYRRRNQWTPYVEKLLTTPKPRPGQVSTYSPEFGQGTQFQRSSDSPGSGRPALQPRLLTSWGAAGGYNFGSTGVTYDTRN